MYVLNLPALGTYKMVMMARELLGQLEPAVIIGPSHTPHHPDITQDREIAIGAALGQLGSGLEDLWNGERSPVICKDLHQGASQARVTLILPGQSPLHRPVQRLRQRSVQQGHRTLFSGVARLTGTGHAASPHSVLVGFPDAAGTEDTLVRRQAAHPRPNA